MALELAVSGKLFSGLNGWTPEEITLANAVLAYRTGRNLSKEAVLAILDAYPLKYSCFKEKEELHKHIDKKYSADQRKNLGLNKAFNSRFNAFKRSKRRYD